MARILSVDQWAKTHEISRQTAYERIRSHRIELRPDGKLDADAADATWNASRNVLQQARARGGSAEPAATGGEQVSGLAATQLKREQIRMQKEAISLRQLQGSLVPAEYADHYIGTMIQEARTLLMVVGPRLRDKLARQSSPAKCDALVTAEITKALQKLVTFKPPPTSTK